MEDFYEIMDFCGFDMEKAHELAKESPFRNAINEILNEVGLEKWHSDTTTRIH